MAHIVTSQDIPVDGEFLEKGKVAKVKAIAGLVAVVGLIASCIFFLINFEKGSALQQAQYSFAYSWLYGFFFCATISMGGCFWPMLHNLSNSGWGTSVRRVMENLGFVFPFMVVFAIPFLFPNVQTALWEWMGVHAEARKAADISLYQFWGSGELAGKLTELHEALLAAKTWYLNQFAWYVRFAFYFLALGYAIYRTRKYSVDQDNDENPTTKNLFAARGAAARYIPIVGISITFMAIDLVMALDYKWFSTMWGVYVFAGCVLNSMAVIMLTTILLRRAGYMKKVVGSEHDHVMGKLTFAFTVFWAYITFSQFFLYWYADVTEETSYFILRNTEHWNTFSIGLVLFHFGLPFILLLNQGWKKNHRFMIAILSYTLCMHAFDVYHMIIPERGPSLGLILNNEAQLTVPHAWWGDLIALVIVVSGFLFFYLRNLTSVALYPHRDPRILESANLHN